MGRGDSYALLPLARQMADDPVWLVDALLAQPQVNGIEELDELESGLRMTQDALELSCKIGDRARELRSLIARTNLLIISNNPAWQQVGQEALVLAREIGDLQAEIHILLSIGSAYGMDNVEKSMVYLQEALNLCLKQDDKETEINLLSAIGAQYERNGDYYHLLTEYEQKRLQISREIGNRLSEGNALMFCGQIQGLYLGDYETGLDLSKEALTNWEGTSGKLFPLLRVAQILGAVGKYDEALATLEQARNDVERNIYDLGRVGFNLVSAIIYNALGDEGHLRMALELTGKIRQMVANNMVSRQYHMAAACESVAAHLKLADSIQIDSDRQEHYRQALEASQTALDIYRDFGFVQVVECSSEEILYRHSLALAANNRTDEADEYMEKAYEETMRKHALIPRGEPLQPDFPGKYPVTPRNPGTLCCAKDETKGKKTGRSGWLTFRIPEIIPSRSVSRKVSDKGSLSCRIGCALFSGTRTGVENIALEDGNSAWNIDFLSCRLHRLTIIRCCAASSL